jgi:hypothetical protein
MTLNFEIAPGRIMDALKLYFYEGFRIKDLPDKISEDFKKTVERFFQAIKTMYFLGSILIPLILVFFYSILAWAGITHARVNHTEIIVYVMYGEQILFYAAFFFSLSFNKNNYNPDSLAATNKIYRSRVTMLIMFILSTVFFVYILWNAGATWYQSLPQAVITAAVIALNYSTRRRLDKWRNGF